MSEELVMDADLAAMAAIVGQRPQLDLATVDVPALRAVVNAAAWPTESTAMASVEAIALSGGDGPLAARLYKPRDDRNLPLLVFLHGGGFVLCSLDTHDNFCRALAKAGDCAVLSVDYRLAPEHKFPAAYRDAVAALEWAACHAARLGCDPERLAIAGDSAGGNLAIAAALHASQTVKGVLRHLLAFYPAIDPSASGASYDRFSAAPFLSAEMMRWYWAQYLDTRQNLDDQRVAVMKSAMLASLPDTTLAIAAIDPLRDEGEAFCRTLADAGVAVDWQLFGGVSHGFATMIGLIGKARIAIDYAGNRLRQSFKGAA